MPSPLEQLKTNASDPRVAQVAQQHESNADKAERLLLAKQEIQRELREKTR